MLVLQFLLYYLIVDGVRSYYFYNKKINHVISWPNLTDVPEGYRLIQPPKALRLTGAKFVKGLYCQDMGFTCTEKFNKTFTYQFECANDSQCPNQFICCPQKCFTHKVCSKGSIYTKKQYFLPKTNRQTPTQVKPNNQGQQEPIRNGQCGKWPQTCQAPYAYAFSRRFKCIYDKQCPVGYNCCQDNCFVHKICLKTNTQEVQEIRRRDQEVQEIRRRDQEVQVIRRRDPTSTSTTSTSTPKMWTTEYQNNTSSSLPEYSDETSKSSQTENVSDISIDNNDQSSTYTEEITTSNIPDTTEFDHREEMTSSKSLKTKEYDQKEDEDQNISTQSSSSNDPNAIDPQFADYYEYKEDNDADDDDDDNEDEDEHEDKTDNYENEYQN